MLERVQASLDKYVSSFDTVTTAEEYEALPEDKRSSYDAFVVQMGGSATKVLDLQMRQNKELKWVHSLSAGIDGYVAVEEFRNNDIPLTNAKGAYSSVLGEFVALGVLYHTKHLERFMQRKVAKKWEPEKVELVSNKHMAVVGYGDIGAACARIAKLGFQMKVTGVKRNPDSVPEENRAYCDEIVGNDQYERVISEADFVVGVLPKVAGVTDDFFNLDSTFSKMKSSAVFMNIGRGTTVNEDDLVVALKTNKISGAVLDVFKTEPLPTESELWSLPNLLMTPHCADQDSEYIHRSMQYFVKNLENFCSGGKDSLINVCDKKAGY